MQPGPDELEWRQPEALHRLYQLTRGGEVIATLCFEKRSGSLATGESGKNQWTLKRTGFRSPRVSVREAGSEADVAIFTPGWTGSGWLTFNSDRRYQLRSMNFWATEWDFEAEDGSPTVILTGPHGIFKQGGHLRATESRATLPETPVLHLLIWYLRMLMNEDASAAAVIATCNSFPDAAPAPKSPGHQPPATGHQQPATSHHSPPTSNQQPATSHQPPAASALRTINSKPFSFAALATS